MILPLIEIIVAGDYRDPGEVRSMNDAVGRAKTCRFPGHCRIETDHRTDRQVVTAESHDDAMLDR
jgi:hypothetical protein